MLLQAIFFIASMVYGYGQLNTRISFLEYQVAVNKDNIQRIEEDADANQDAEIPADIKQNQRIDFLEREVMRLRDGNK